MNATEPCMHCNPVRCPPWSKCSSKVPRVGLGLGSRLNMLKFYNHDKKYYFLISYFKFSFDPALARSLAHSPWCLGPFTNLGGTKGLAPDAAALTAAASSARPYT